jgi:hypothetical protein
MTGQRSNQLNYVPNRGINNLAQNLANKAFARFAYGALAALDACPSPKASPQQCSSLSAAGVLANDRAEPRHHEFDALTNRATGPGQRRYLGFVLLWQYVAEFS